MYTIFIHYSKIIASLIGNELSFVLLDLWSPEADFIPRHRLIKYLVLVPTLTEKLGTGTSCKEKFQTGFVVAGVGFFPIGTIN